MIPAVDDRLLPDMQSAYAKNCWLYSGALRGIATPEELYTLQNTSSRKVFRIPINFYDKEHLAESYWLEFEDIDTDVVQAPIVDDTYDRYYWACPTDYPRYNTLANITVGTGYLGSNGYRLGVPPPPTAPTLVPSGGAGVSETRSYVRTWVTAYGEEGPPSPPVTVSGKVDDTWVLTFYAAGAPYTNERNITLCRIYRTITSTAGVATYFFVAEVAYSATTYSDTRTSAAVAEENQLESIDWTEPPEDLEGFTVMPNGLIAGFREREIWFCEPYRPHAWPTGYTLSVENPIVGLGVVGQSLIVLTTGAPYALVGTTPGNMSLAKMASIEPCFSRGSIVSAPEGVYFASPNGLMLATQGTILNVTKNSFTKNVWMDLFDVTKLRATRVGSSYYAFGNISIEEGVFNTNAFYDSAFEVADYTFSRDGFIFDTVSERVSVSLLYSETPTVNIMTDQWSGEPFVLRGGKVYWLNTDEDADREVYFWKSKVFQPSIKKNFEALRIWFDVPTFMDAPTVAIRRQTTYENDMYGMVRVRADGQLILSREFRTSGEIIRLPSGFRAALWQVEFEGRATIFNVEMATSMKELMGV